MKYGLIVALLWFCMSAVQAKTFALVIGVDQYVDQSLTDLDGAVNDARDIHNALVTNVTTPDSVRLLLNEQATKTNIRNAWNDMVRNSRTNDVLMISYAGHGSQIDDQNGDEQDRLDEVILLGGYRRGAADAYDHIISDDEWYRWFAAARGRQVVFVSDSCNSGTLHRGLGGRKSRYQDVPTGIVPPPSHVQYKEERANQNHVTFFAATTEDMDSYERNINGRSRGLLSYAFANALRGAADDGDRVLQKLELENYIFNTVTALTENQMKQIPQFIPEGHNTKKLFPIKRSSGKASGKFNVFFTQGNVNKTGRGVTVNIQNHGFPYLTLYNINGHEGVEFLYPHSGDSPKINSSFQLPMKVTQVKGDEQLVAIVSAKPLTQVHQFLQQHRRADASFDKRISQLLAHEKMEIKRVKHEVQ